MLNERALSVANTYWANHFGCLSNELFGEPLSVVIHGKDLADYKGAFGLFGGDGGAIASIPMEWVDVLRTPLASFLHDCSPEDFASTLRPFASSTVGPAYVGYAESVPHSAHPARTLGPADASSIDALRHACDADDWAHGGSDNARPCSAVFVGGQIAALAGYEIWGGIIAHLSVITHPDFRNRGLGRSAVGHLAGRAFAAGLLPQYRTLMSNHSSVRIAESLGFCSYATSVAVRFEGGV